MQNIKDNFETYFQYRSTITSQESRETDDQNVLFPNILLCSGNNFITCYDSLVMTYRFNAFKRKTCPVFKSHNSNNEILWSKY